MAPGMADHEQVSATDIALAVGKVSILEDRVQAHLDEVRDLRDDGYEHSKQISSLEATLLIFGNQLESVKTRQEKRRDPWANIIAGVGVLLTIGILALGPIAWLAITNSDRHDLTAEIILKRSELVGEVRANMDAAEESIELLNHRLEIWNTRIENRIITLEQRVMDQ